MLYAWHIHILVTVISNFLQFAHQTFCGPNRFPEFTLPTWKQTGLILALAVLASTDLWASEDPAARQREEFSQAWQAASMGKRTEFEGLMPGLSNYLLYPYLEYEDFRYRRAVVDVQDMAVFLESHQDWAFTAGLKTAWLRTLGERGKWDALLTYADGSADTEVQCYLAQARIQRGQTEGLVPVARSLWAVGKSQPDACDPVFTWLRKQGGITPALAWERIERAMEARQPRLTLYLARYLDEEGRVWADRWYQQDRGGYRQLDRARNWPDQEKSRDITAYGLQRLARSDADRSWRTFESIANHFEWPEDVRGGIQRNLALWSAVEGADATPQRMQNVPDKYRDGKLMEWWARFNLSRGDWGGLITVIENMPEEQKNDSGWRYWGAVARLETGDPERARELLGELAIEAGYYGFLSADRLGFPYTICPEEPGVDPGEIAELRQQPGFQRSLELRKAGIVNWSRSEWQIAVKSLDQAGLRVAAALAVEENWPDMAIFALGNSGDRRWYAWRFPVEYASLVETQAGDRNLDPAWVMGLMRSESAMAEDAMSSAGARGLMQLMPETAKQLARRHSISYTGQRELMQAEENIVLGTTYLRELLDRFNGNPVLASGAYNAGPRAVERWLANRRTDDPAIWVETLPYFETRDYIPRVLAFSTIYDWRMAKPVARISSRMPEFYSGAGGGNMKITGTAEIVCRTPG